MLLPSLDRDVSVDYSTLRYRSTGAESSDQDVGNEEARMADGRSSVSVEEVDIASLRAWMEGGGATARQIVEAYVARIQQLDGRLRSVLEINPDAIAIADALDGERAAGRTRGPLHGIPILLKDNIDTADL